MDVNKTPHHFNAGNCKNVNSIIISDKTWIYLSENKHQSYCWMFLCKEITTTVIRSRSISKMIVATFFSKACDVETISLQDRKPVTAD